MQQVIIIWISDEISSRCKIEWLRNLVGSIADKFRGWDLILTFSRGTKIRLKLCSLHNSKKKNSSALMYELAIVQIGKSSWMVWHDLCASRTCHTVELCLHKMALMSIWCRLINFANLTIWSFCLSIFLSFCLSVFLSFCLSVFCSVGDGWMSGWDGWMDGHHKSSNNVYKSSRSLKQWTGLLSERQGDRRLCRLRRPLCQSNQHLQFEMWF